MMDSIVLLYRVEENMKTLVASIKIQKRIFTVPLILSMVLMALAPSGLAASQPATGSSIPTLGCNPEIPVAPGEEHWLLDTSLDEVYWPCSHSRAIPSFPSQLEWKIGLPWANTRGILNSPS